MDQIISEHLHSRSFNLLFNVELIFIGTKSEISIFGEEMFRKSAYGTDKFWEYIILDKKKEGISIWYFNTGQYWLKGRYRKDEREGLWISWYKNGQKHSEGNYRNGKEEGLWTYWGENGQKLTEVNYRNGQRELI